MGLFGFFSERKARREEEDRLYYEEQEQLKREQDRSSRSKGAPEDVVIKTDVGFTPEHIIYRIRITNDSQDPMGDVDVTVLPDKKMGIPLNKTQKIDMLDPDETTVLDFKIVPVLNLGKGTVKAQMSYFDFAEQDRVTFNLKTRSVQLSCPKIQPMKVDDDLWRIRMTNLEKFEYESEEVHGVASNLFDELCQSAESIGFFGTEPFVVPNLYRGIRKFMGTVGEEVFACQVQVIGQEDISKVLMECYASSTEKAMGVTARIITPLDSQYHLKKQIKSDLDPLDRKTMVETSAGEKFDESVVKILGKDQKYLGVDRKVVRKKRAVKKKQQPVEEEKVEVWEAQKEVTVPLDAVTKSEEKPVVVEEAPASIGEPQVVRKIRMVAD